MIEVEIKAKITDFTTIKNSLNNKGANFLRLSDEIDTIFGMPKYLNAEHKVIEGGLIARIRQRDGKKILEFKEIQRKNGGIELKMEISDIIAIKKFLEKLDFIEAFIIKKTRQIYTYNNFKVCLDDVDQLGRFIEIEKIVNSDNEKDEARNDCLKLLKELAPNAVIENKKYGDLIQDILNNKLK
jgi:adenylate cyclase, class 2